MPTLLTPSLSAPKGILVKSVIHCLDLILGRREWKHPSQNGQQNLTTSEFVPESDPDPTRDGTCRHHDCPRLEPSISDRETETEGRDCGLMGPFGKEHQLNKTT